MKTPPRSYSSNFTIVMPCLNEERTIAACIDQINELGDLLETRIPIIVADNGSSDKSVDIATAKGARVIAVSKRGYGAALDAGIRSAETDWVVIGDSDLSYDFGDANRLVEAGISNSSDLVMGNRFMGGIEPGAMPALHKYIGNPFLSYVGRTFFNIPIGDFHCGLRAMKKDSYLKASPVSVGMEFATEMVIKFANANLKITEFPTSLKKDGRDRKPHLRSFPDGWRHLKLMMLYAPQFTLLFPGFFLTIIGLSILTIYGITGRIHILSFKGDISAAEMMSLLTIFGVQLFVAGSVSIANAKVRGIGKFRWVAPRYSRSRARFVLGFPLLLIISSSASLFRFGLHWLSLNQGHLDPISSTRVTIVGVTTFLIGSQLLIGAIQVRQIVSKFWD